MSDWAAKKIGESLQWLGVFLVIGMINFGTCSKIQIVHEQPKQEQSK